MFLKVSGVFQQNFKDSKNSAVLEPTTVQFLRIWGFEAKDFKRCLRGRPWAQERAPSVIIIWEFNVLLTLKNYFYKIYLDMHFATDIRFFNKPLHLYFK